jgi:predicted transcriptional regulator
VGPRASLDAQKNTLHFNTKQVITSTPKKSAQKNILNVAYVGLNVTPEKKCLFISAKNSSTSQKFITINNTKFPDTVVKTVTILETVLSTVLHMFR